MGILAEDVQRVRETTDLVALAAEHIQLKRVGRSVTGLCPFHTEKSPSFSISPEKGVFYCVDTRAVKPFPKPVTLATVKADAKLKSMKLAREPRLSVQPVNDEEWKQICRMGGVKD